MDRQHLQNLAVTRIEDAKALLDQGRWAAAYYLTGYALECGLKSCLLRYLGESGALFSEEKKYLKRLADCWTHELGTLLGLAGLEKDFGIARSANPALDGFWGTARDWEETSRYELKTEVDATALYEAVAHDPNGVLKWIQSRW